MNFVKRAILSSKARMGKTVILFAVMLTVCVVVLAGFGIQSATEKSSILARQKLGAEVTLQVDMEKLRNEMMSSSASGGERIRMTQLPVPLEYLEELKDSEYVLNYLISTVTAVNAEDILPVGEEEEDESDNPMAHKMLSRGDLSINGVSELYLSQEFQNGDIEIIEGREIKSEDKEEKVAVIEETLASENNLNLGDKITVYNPIEEDNKLELEIVGIYKNYGEFTDIAFNNTSSSPFNQIFAPYKVVNTFKGEDYNNSVDKMVFYLNDPVNVEKFIKEGSNTSIDFDKFILDADNGSYEEMMGPIENVASFSSTALILVAAFGGVILALIIMLSIKDRISEIGILLSLGESKFKIIGQFLAEVLLILVISLGVAVITGGPISNAISDKLLTNEIQVVEEQQQGNVRPGIGKNSISTRDTVGVETIEELNVEIGTGEFLQMSLVSILVAIIATIIPAGFIMRLHPKNILSKHN